MRHKTHRWVVLAALAVTVAAAFAATAVGATERQGALDGKKVGVIICTNQNPFCAAWANSVKSGLEKQGATVTVLTSVFDPAVDAQNMNRLIADKPDLIISVPASASAIVPSYIRAKRRVSRFSARSGASQAGRERSSSPPRRAPTTLRSARFAAQNLVEGMKKAGYTKGNVIALTGTASQNNVTDRMAAFSAYMKKYPQYKIVAIEDTNWDQATSAKVAQQLLSKYASKGGIQGAYGMADNMAIGIIQGAKQAGVPVGVAKKGLVVTGSNCLTVGIKAIKAGSNTAPGRRRRRSRRRSRSRWRPRSSTAPRRPRCRTSAEQRITKANVAQVHEGLHLLSGTGPRTACVTNGIRHPWPDPVVSPTAPLRRRPPRGRGLSKSYGPVRAIQGLTLDVRAGEVHAICGHNGAGKSRS